MGKILFKNFSYHELLKMWRTLKVENMGNNVDQVFRNIHLNKLMDEYEKEIIDLRSDREEKK